MSIHTAVGDVYTVQSTKHGGNSNTERFFVLLYLTEQCEEVIEIQQDVEPQHKKQPMKIQTTLCNNKKKDTNLRNVMDTTHRYELYMNMNWPYCMIRVVRMKTKMLKCAKMPHSAAVIIFLSPL